MTLVWILLATFLMSLLALAGLVFFAMKEPLLNSILEYLVAFAAGSLIGGSFFHLIPEAIQEVGNQLAIYIWLVGGFTLFLLMEQFLNWHHAHSATENTPKPVTYLILFADGVHNFLGGLAIGSSFLVSPEVGVITWLIAAAHEIPQEFGDFAILVHGGLNRTRALTYNFISALAIVPGGLLAYLVGGNFRTIFLLPFAAGSFIYIAASDLIPEIKHARTLLVDLLNVLFFLGGMGLILGTRLLIAL